MGIPMLESSEKRTRRKFATAQTQRVRTSSRFRPSVSTKRRAGRVRSILNKAPRLGIKGVIQDINDTDSSILHKSFFNYAEISCQIYSKVKGVIFRIFFDKFRAYFARKYNPM
jgi:hypothetical protein